MEMEEKQVLLNRANILQSYLEKEWWFSYLYDPERRVYFSWTFVRSFFLEKFKFWFQDLETGQSWSVDRSLYLEKGQKAGELDLQYHKKGIDLAYRSDGQNDVTFRYHDDKHRIDLKLTRASAPFTKRDNPFVYHYGLLHYFQDRVRGTLELEGHRYQVDTPQSYYDHCFGKVPARTGWHWLAVQNAHTALASLTNYGAYAQKYTQVHSSEGWVRLSEDVTFDYDPKRLMEEWRVTSSDLELVVTPLHLHRERVAVPPGIPFLVNLWHNEFFVRVRGRIRIRDEWRDAGEMYGVMEEHHGRW